MSPRSHNPREQGMTFTDATPSSGAEINPQLELFQIFNEVPYLSVKHDSYFQVYEELLRPYVGRPITFVEIGIFHGGSLFMGESSQICSTPWGAQ